MASFYIPLSGLNADSRALNTIANNLSNMNTTSYKSQKTNFSDLFYQQIGVTGSGNSIQVGGGVKIASNSADFTQGSFNTSGTTASDVALDGNGFFLVNDGNGVNLLTRNGAFTQQSNGNLVTADGLSVMGYPAVKGVVNTSAQLTAITIPVIGQMQQPQATTSFGMTANLDSSAANGATVPGQVQVFDSLGNSYEATVTYTKTGTNQWSYSVTLPDTLTAIPTVAPAGVNYNFGSSGGTVAKVNPGTNLTLTGLTAGGTSATIVAPTVTSGETVAQYVTALNTAIAAAGIVGVSASSTAGGQLSIVGPNLSSTGKVIQDPVPSANSTGSLTFDSSGNLVSPAADIAAITFSGLSDGAANLNMTWNLYGASGKPTIGQVDSTSSTSAQTQNGYTSGSYESFAIDSDGTVTATYSNGQTQAVGQLALANVTNLQGLELKGSGNYATTLASGAASVGVSGVNGLGKIQGSSLEQSNVNISAEFSNLIIAQRGFEANSKAITTFDTIAQETINMIH